MKVLLVNGSPHENGCTYTALSEIANILKLEGIESEVYFIGNEPIAPCRGCRACAKLGKCVIDDEVNKFLEKAREFDAYVLGSPVHYAAASGNMASFMHRVFYSDSASGKKSFRHKPAFAVASARRAGTTVTLDQLNKYFQINEMPIISGRYWNMVHGASPDDVKKDEEGMQNMRILAKNLAWFLKCKEAGLKVGIEPPAIEAPIMTNFIR